jgi:hypothetical protein
VHEIMSKGVECAVHMTLLSAAMTMCAKQDRPAIQAGIVVSPAITGFWFHRARNSRAGYDIRYSGQFLTHVACLTVLCAYTKRKKARTNRAFSKSEI